MSETLSKIRLYLREADRYWVSVPARERRGDDLLYPVDFTPRLTDGHFRHFDDRGLPLKPTPTKSVHNYTRICGWALAHCGRARDGDLSATDRDALRLAADYIVESGVRSPVGLLLQAEVPGLGHVGGVSSMAQGQAMSVLVRAHTVFGNDGYLDAACELVGPFRARVEEGGVTARILGGATWYEEDARTPPRHILNGMVFALWGLSDVARSARLREADELYGAGLDAVRRTIGRFDRGWWSNYDAPEASRPYIASMRYHGLHVAQLEVLGEEDPLLADTAERFAGYAAGVSRRLRAALALAIAKLRGDYRHGG